MNKTQIEWVKNPDGTQGYTWNPITGCLNGCEYCYARKLANGRLRDRYLANKNVAITHLHEPVAGYEALADPFYPRFWEDRMLDVPIKNYEPNKHLGIFVCDMSDLFGIGVPEEWTRRILTKIRTGGAWHRFYLLTKQPQNLAKFSPFPDNCWVGVTACNQTMLQKALSSEGLASAKAGAKFISFEPLLQRMDGLADYLYCVDWVIIGAQTKPVVYPKVEWVEEIVEACDKARVPVFLKDNLGRFLPRRLAEQPGNLYPKDGWYPLRQEMPEYWAVGK
jgi:protein gp37